MQHAYLGLMGQHTVCMLILHRQPFFVHLTETPTGQLRSWLSHAPKHFLLYIFPSPIFPLSFSRFEFCVFVAGWRLALRSEWPFININVNISIQIFHFLHFPFNFPFCLSSASRPPTSANSSIMYPFFSSLPYVDPKATAPSNVDWLFMMLCNHAKLYTIDQNNKLVQRAVLPRMGGKGTDYCSTFSAIGEHIQLWSQFSLFFP